MVDVVVYEIDLKQNKPELRLNLAFLRCFYAAMDTDENNKENSPDFLIDLQDRLQEIRSKE